MNLYNYKLLFSQNSVMKINRRRPNKTVLKLFEFVTVSSLNKYFDVSQFCSEL